MVAFYIIEYLPGSLDHDHITDFDDVQLRYKFLHIYDIKFRVYLRTHLLGFLGRLEGCCVQSAASVGESTSERCSLLIKRLKRDQN